MDKSVLDEIRSWIGEIDISDLSEYVQATAPEFSNWIEVLKLMRQAQDAARTGAFKNAETLCIRLLRIAETLDMLPMELMAKNMLASTYSETGKYKEALAIYTQIVALSSDPSIGAKYQEDADRYYSMLGPVAPAIGRIWDDAADRVIATAFASLVDVAPVDDNLPIPLLHNILDEGIRFINAVGHPNWEHSFRFQRAYLLELEGDLDAALDQARIALTMRERDLEGPGQSLVIHLCFLGEYLIMLKRYEDAKPYFERAYGVQGLAVAPKRRVLAGLGDCYFYTNDLMAAETLSEEEMQLAQKIDTLSPLRSAYSFRCLVRARQGRLEDSISDAYCMWQLTRRLSSPGLYYWTYRRIAQARYWLARRFLGLADTMDLPSQLTKPTLTQKETDIIRRQLRSANRWIETTRRRAKSGVTNRLGQNRLAELESLRNDILTLLSICDGNLT